MASRDQESTPSEETKIEKDEKRTTQEKEDGGSSQLVPPPAAVPEKHPLQNKWVLWYYKSDKSKDWMDNLKQIVSFDTVEDFWGVFNHVKTPSQIPNGCDYMLFKHGIRPMWEDTTNKQGGRWLLTLDKQYRRDGTFDNNWTETLMCLVGEVFDESSDEVCGAVVQNRTRGDKLSLWTKDCKAEIHIRRIGVILKDKLTINMGGDKFQLVYQSHAVVASKSSSYSAKALMTV